MKYAKLKNGVVVDTIVCDEDFDVGPEFTKELFDPAIHVKTPVAPTSIEVTKFHFFNNLHTLEQATRLRFALKRASSLTEAEVLLDANKPLAALAHLQESVLPYIEKIDLIGSRTEGYYAAAKAIGIYGSDSAEADSEIARIKQNKEPV